MTITIILAVILVCCIFAILYGLQCLFKTRIQNKRKNEFIQKNPSFKEGSTIIMNILDNCGCQSDNNTIAMVKKTYFFIDEYKQLIVVSELYDITNNKEIYMMPHFYYTVTHDTKTVNIFDKRLLSSDELISFTYSNLLKNGILGSGFEKAIIKEVL